jgi:hypothetical protein
MAYPQTKLVPLKGKYFCTQRRDVDVVALQRLQERLRYPVVLGALHRRVAGLRPSWLAKMRVSRAM